VLHLEEQAISGQQGQLREIKATDKSSRAGQQAITSEAGIRLLGASVLSFALLVFGFYVLLDGGSSGELQKVATGWIGVVVGYWLK
jgi:hypothetical protein